MALRLATFNLKDFFLPSSPAEEAIVTAKVANVARELVRARADVVALQEIGSPELVDRLVAATGDLGYGTPVLGSADRRGIRNGILSRLPITWSQVHQAKSLPFPRFFEGDPEPFEGRIPLRRGIVHVRVECTDLPSLGATAQAPLEVDILTAHFKSNLPALMKKPDGAEIADSTVHAAGESAVRSLVQRAAEALYMRGLVDGIFERSPDHAICVMGDLNDTLESLPIRLLRGLDPSSTHHLHAAEEAVPAARRFSCFHGNAPTLIDHILLGPRLHSALATCEILNEALRYHGPHSDDIPLTEDSDHALVVCELA